MLNYFFKCSSFECHDYWAHTSYTTHIFISVTSSWRQRKPNQPNSDIDTLLLNEMFIASYWIFLKPRFRVTAHLISFGTTAPSVNKYSYSLFTLNPDIADGCTLHYPAHTHTFSLNTWIWTILTVLKGVHIQLQGAQRIAGSCQDLNIIIWPHNPTVTWENTGFIILFFSTGMFVSISLLSDSWLWKMSWEGVPFLILSLESSQTRFVPVSTSFIIPIRQTSHVLKHFASFLHHIQSICKSQCRGGGGLQLSCTSPVPIFSKLCLYHTWNNISPFYCTRLRAECKTQCWS